MKKRQKNLLIRIITSALLTALFGFIKTDGIFRFFLYLIPYLIIGYDILKKALHGIKEKQVFDENFLMSIATLGAIILAVANKGDYLEAIAVMLFYQIGELFQSLAVNKSRKNILSLMDIRPDYANIESNGVLIKVSPDKVKKGSIIVVQPGEKIPIDGIIDDGSSLVDTSALTGESIPCELKIGDEALSGYVSLSGVIRIKTTKDFSQSTASKILELVENASSRKSHSENFISKFARIYTPAVCISSLVLAFLPPLLNFSLGNSPEIEKWLYRALTFLVVSCPCALVISIPLAFFAGIGKASKEGVLIKGANFLESLAKTKYIVFDKTGTLTEGSFKVNGVHHNTIDEKLIIEYAALCEIASSHPISQSIKNAYQKELERKRVTNIRELHGKGIISQVDGKEIAVGNDKLMEYLGIQYVPCHHSGTIVHICADGKYLGHILVSDKIKETSKEAISALKKLGIKKTFMLTGDRKSSAEEIASLVGVDGFHSELLPEDKVKKTNELLSEKDKGSFLAFVGDGINDAPVLALSDIGIAMGAIGSDAAIEAADVVLIDDNPLKIAKAIKISKKCLRIVSENIIFSIGIKLLCLLLTALGSTSMYFAIFADVGVMIIAVINAIRVLY